VAPFAQVAGAFDLVGVGKFSKARAENFVAAFARNRQTQFFAAIECWPTTIATFRQCGFNSEKIMSSMSFSETEGGSFTLFQRNCC